MNYRPDIFSGLRSAWSLYNRLFRFYEDVFYVSMASLFGIISSTGEFGWKLLLVLISNWLVSGLSNVFQNINSAPSDVIQSRGGNENPIAKGEVRLITVKLVATIAWLISLTSFFLLGWKVGLIGLLLSVLSWGCHHHSIGMERIQFSFVICQGLIKAALPFLTAYFTFQTHLNKIWLYPFLCMLAFRIYIDSSGLLKDMKSAKNISKPRFAYLSVRGGQLFTLIFLVVGIITGLITIVILDIIPLWVNILSTVLVFIFLIPQFTKMHQSRDLLHLQTPLHIPVEKAVAIALLMQFLIPWIIRFY